MRAWWKKIIAWWKKIIAWWKNMKVGDKLTAIGLVLTALALLAALGFLPNRHEPSDRVAPTTTTAPREPLEITVEADPGIIDPDISTQIVIPRGRTIVGGPRECGELQTWANQYGGVPTAKSSQMRVTLQGGSSQPIVISSMKARVVGERRRPLVGTTFACGGEGEIEPKTIHIDLDKSSPTAVYLTKKGPKKFAFELLENETLVFDVEPTTLKCYCKWVIDLKVLIGGKPSTRIIQNGGRPFEITPSLGGQYYFWAEDRWTIGPEYQKEWPFDRPIKT
jgi:hypothetical protein